MQVSSSCQWSAQSCCRFTQQGDNRRDIAATSANFYYDLQQRSEILTVAENFNLKVDGAKYSFDTGMKFKQANEHAIHYTTFK